MRRFAKKRQMSRFAACKHILTGNCLFTFKITALETFVLQLLRLMAYTPDSKIA